MPIILFAIRYFTWRGLAAGVVLGGLYGGLVGLASAGRYTPLDGATMGMLAGALVGGEVSGIVFLLGGALAGLLTQAFFDPLTDVARFRQIAGSSVVGFIAISALIGFGLVSDRIPPVRAPVVIGVFPAGFLDAVGVIVTLRYLKAYARQALGKKKKRGETD